jgi:hypothetical protein
MRQLQRAYAIADSTAPSGGLPARANILSALIAYRMGRPDVALSSLAVAFEQLRRDNTDRPNNINYLFYYCRQLCEFCAGKFTEQSEQFLSLAAQFVAAGGDFDPSRVRGDIRRVFPLAPAI